VCWPGHSLRFNLEVSGRPESGLRQCASLDKPHRAQHASPIEVLAPGAGWCAAALSGKATCHAASIRPLGHRLADRSGA
jgi:hypothetical protein